MSKPVKCSGVYQTTYQKMLAEFPNAERKPIAYRYNRPSIVQITLVMVDDTVDRDFRLNIDQMFSYSWNTKAKTLSDEEFVKWVFERVKAYHRKNPDYVITGHIDCVSPEQMKLL